MAEPVDMPAHLSTVFVVLGANPLRNAIGAVFFGYDNLKMNPWPLMILDWSLSKFDEITTWLPSVSSRVKELTTECGALSPSHAIWIERDGIGESLLPALYDAGHEEVQFVPDVLAALTLQERAVGGSAYAHRGLVMFTRGAFEKECEFQGTTRNHLLAQMTSFGITSEDPEASELFSAWCAGVLLALEDPPRRSSQSGRPRSSSMLLAR